MESYHHLLKAVLNNGEDRGDRTGIGTKSLFGWSLRLNNSHCFPLLTTKKMFFKGIACELFWFLKGNTNIRELQRQGVHIWDSWADKYGNLGPIYGKQWRDWNGVDQIQNLLDKLRSNPTSRRLVVSSWNVGELKLMVLPPCHVLMQFYVNNINQLSCQVYQRSADIFLGVPFNIASYALLVKLIAHTTNLTPGELIFCYGDLHLYCNHFEQARTQLERIPRICPVVQINPTKRNLFDIGYDDLILHDYDPHPAIPAPIAV